MEPTLASVKDDVVAEAKMNHENYVARASRIKEERHKFLPKDWEKQFDPYEEEGVEQDQAKTRVELMLENVFGDTLSFDPVMG